MTWKGAGTVPGRREAAGAPAPLFAKYEFFGVDGKRILTLQSPHDQAIHPSQAFISISDRRQKPYVVPAL